MSKLLEEIYKYSEIETAENIRYMKDSKSAIYMWYFPINLKTFNSDINDASKHFYENDLVIYDKVTRLVLEDQRRKLKSVVSFFGPSSNSQIRFKPDIPKGTDKQIANTILSLSTLASPIYIGKATRGDSVQGRLKQHLNMKSDFARSLDAALKGSSYTISDMMVRVIDIETLIIEKEFDKSFIEGFDFAEYLERILINLFKPVYNIKN